MDQQLVKDSPNIYFRFSDAFHGQYADAINCRYVSYSSYNLAMVVHKLRLITHTLLIFIFFAVLISCGGLRKADKIHIVVREAPRALISGKALIEYNNGERIIQDSTNEFGYIAITADSFVKQKMDFKRLQVTARYKGRSATVYLNEFNSFYDLYMSPVEPAPDSNRVADMHFHVSMRPYNAFGNDISTDSVLPGNFNWLRVEKNLKYFTGYTWKKFDMKWDFTNSHYKRRLKTYLSRKWIRPVEGANNLKHYSEATFPHMVEGNVYLAFNAISPFEHGLTNEGIKRSVSSAMKSGADINWLKELGQDGHITHWKNFKREHSMIISQDSEYNNYSWSTLRKGDDLEKKLKLAPVIVNVAEGGHLFQDKYFPHAINFDLMDTASQKKKDLFDKILRVAARTGDSEIRALFERERKSSNGRKDTLINDVLMNEILHNVDEFKRMNVPMISISHLSYNGMTGHAPALDVSKKPALEAFTSYLAKRAFGIRVSNDRQNKKSFDGLFFRVPGVNKFGEAVITRLLNSGKDTSYVHIDLKHSDVPTRRYILDIYEQASLKLPKKLAPICSHCAVNGLSIDYTSPLLNEYSLLGSSLARKFYPFSINLYNEEVKRICENDGIIGVPIEERVLGGYINNRQDWLYEIRSGPKGAYLANVKHRTRKEKYIKEAIRYMKLTSTKEFKKVFEFYQAEINRDSVYLDDENEEEQKPLRENAVLKTIYEDYLSAEPFLQNVFHIVDIARRCKSQMKLDSILAVANASTRKSMQSQLLQRSDINESVSKTKAEQFNRIDSRHLGKKDTDSMKSQIDKEVTTNITDTAFQRTYVQTQFQVKLDSMIDQIKNMIDADRKLLEQKVRRDSWKNVCFGSDLDGMIDPINICPSASQFPIFKEKLKVLIPLFISIRHTFEVKEKLLSDPYGDFEHYFNNDFRVDEALNMLFYNNLKEFTVTNFVL